MNKSELKKDLYKLFTSIRSEKEAQMLLEDILTPSELESISKRWKELKDLSDGVPQRTIAKKLGISISKVTRGSRVISEGSGGAKLFLKRLQKNEQ
ncbi:transcriptional regulator [Candidatus Peribacteria bacterium]|jgi:TrpR family transcriptional regulator, trp operon repressor|nr:transcriptional regulator [Candidatus Peribacteria bacterium]MBT4021074.1 transcriptional regulator [Candidatus Peribacteria bacterium]MBT4240795.1 transcriptional regulator [Candidatus Peribacteria bacterium]MBT4474176.1 transcriptional regulator [Candidatus Peribacteria bacterium]